MNQNQNQSHPNPHDYLNKDNGNQEKGSRILAPDSSPIKNERGDHWPTPSTKNPSKFNSPPTSLTSTPTQPSKKGSGSLNRDRPSISSISSFQPADLDMSSERYKAQMSNSTSSFSSRPRPIDNNNRKSSSSNSASPSTSTSSKPIKNPRTDLSKFSSQSQQLVMKKVSSTSSSNNTQKSKRSVSKSSDDDGDSDDDDSDEDSDQEKQPPRKKSKFRRGGIKTPPLESPTQPSSIKTMKSNGHDVYSVSTPSTSNNNTPSQPSNQEDLRTRRLFDHLIKNGHGVSLDQCIQTMKEFNGKTSAAIEDLKNRFPKGSLKPSPSVTNGNGVANGNGKGKGTSSTTSSNSTPTTVNEVRKKTAYDDDDERDTYDHGSDSDGGAQDEEEKQEKAAIKWFNECDEGALIDTTGCSVAQAATIMRLRPFEDVEDAENRLDDKVNKGVTSKLFTHCLELMAGYYEVDNVLEKCEKIGADLHLAMASWNINPTTGLSRSGTPSAGAITAEETSTSTNVDASISEQTTQASTPDTGAPSISTLPKPELIKDPDYLHEQPSNLGANVILKDYQLIGVNWLSLLYRKQTSAILADEMGLGKTAQVIAFLMSLENKGIKGPHLIVVPSSVLENWRREFKMFAPKIHVRSYYGNQNERRELRDELREDKKLNVILTTYDIAAGSDLDHKFLKKRGFNVCVFDEGHMLKNRKSQKYEKLLRISSQWRLLLTGTPLQNNLQELISLLNFIMPEYFKDAEDALTAIFKVKPGAQRNELSQQRVERARKMMQPFVLRRKKDKVLTELCSKIERIELCEMTKEQKKLYQDAMRRTEKALTEEEGEDSKKPVRAGSRLRGGKSGSKENGSNNVLMDLRKAANHPLLFRDYYNDSRIAALAKDYVKEPEHADENLEHLKEDFTINSDAQLSLLANSWPFTQKHKLPDSRWMNAGKIQCLKRLIPEIQSKGDRIVIFSQFTTVLDILCVALDIMGVKYVGFTGQTNVGDRQHIVDQFTNDDSITVFLLSTKAGGLGINLIAANWVIMYDQDFNPQNDKQAADRCYRMGQTKEVYVVKLISTETIDESMLDLGKRKLELANRVSGEGIEAEEGEEVGKSLEKSLLSELKKQMVSGKAASTSTSTSSPQVEELKDEKMN